jgi:hypothetical protein
MRQDSSSGPTGPGPAATTAADAAVRDHTSKSAQDKENASSNGSPKADAPALCENADATSDDPSYGLDDRTRAFYHRAMELLEQAGVPYAVGGAYALAHYAGIVRHTKDLDLFLRERDLQRAFKAFQAEGCRTELTHPHWIGKAYSPDAPASDPSKGAYAFIDLIYGAGNGLTRVDDEWMANVVPGRAVGRPAPLCAAEDIIWSKAFIQERDRFDGADVAHLIRARGRDLDWRRLLARFGDKRAVLLGHVAFFTFVFPSERECVPRWVLDELIEHLRDGRGGPPATAEGQRVCYGTFLSWEQYLPDLRERGFRDGRLQPTGSLTPRQIDRWTDADK